MTLDDVLDQARFGDRITVERRNDGGTYSVLSGPVLIDLGLSAAVGIDLLDGEPHILRREDGRTFGNIVSLTVTRDSRAVATYEGSSEPAVNTELLHAADLYDERDKRARATSIGRTLYWCAVGHGWTFNPVASHAYHGIHQGLTIEALLEQRPTITLTGWAADR